MWLATAANVAVIAVLLTRLHGRTRHAAVAVCITSNVLIGWYVSPENQGPHARFVTGPPSVTYDAQAMRLTAIINVHNDGDRQTIASIINAVWIDSKKGALSDRNRPQPWQIELVPKQTSPVMFVIEGDTAAAVWGGIQLMEVPIDGGYDANAKLNCRFSFVGRFYPQLKQIGTVSSVTSPGECRLRSRPSS